MGVGVDAVRMCRCGCAGGGGGVDAVRMYRCGCGLVSA